MGPFLGALALFETATIAAIETSRYLRRKQSNNDFGSQTPKPDMLHKNLHKSRPQS